MFDLSWLLLLFCLESPVIITVTQDVHNDDCNRDCTTVRNEDGTYTEHCFFTLMYCPETWSRTEIWTRYPECGGERIWTSEWLKRAIMIVDAAA